MTTLTFQISFASPGGIKPQCTTAAWIITWQNEYKQIRIRLIDSTRGAKMDVLHWTPYGYGAVYGNVVDCNKANCIWKRTDLWPLMQNNTNAWGVLPAGPTTRQDISGTLSDQLSDRRQRGSTASSLSWRSTRVSVPTLLLFNEQNYCVFKKNHFKSVDSDLFFLL